MRKERRDYWKGRVWIIYTRLEQVYKNLTVLKREKRIVLETSPLSGFL